jgi:hypothetical protein
MAAIENSKTLQYSFFQSGNKLFLDEYFTVPSGRKWSVDYVSVRLSIPAGTIVRTSGDINENLMRSRYNRHMFEDKTDVLWQMKEDGPEMISPKEK